MAKDFTAPINDFFNTEAEPAELGKAEATTNNEIRYKVDRSELEVKTKRLNLVLQPTVLAHAKERANDLGVSVNEYIHILIKDDYRKNGAK